MKGVIYHKRESHLREICEIWLVDQLIIGVGCMTAGPPQ